MTKETRATRVMTLLSKGKYVVRLAKTIADITRAQTLRFRAFGLGAPDHEGLDRDVFDDLCEHFLVENRETGALVACWRVLFLQSGDLINQSYSAQYYELSNLQSYRNPMIEVGRFCLDPEVNDPDILRVAWGALGQFVDENDIGMMFGCSSFFGTSPEEYHDSFAVLRDRHLGPKTWLPRIKAPKIFDFARLLRNTPDMKKAMLKMPPLLKTYLMMGGWVSDHAVVDDHMNTLHVFTGVEIGRIPPARKRLLRALA